MRKTFVASLALIVAVTFAAVLLPRGAGFPPPALAVSADITVTDYGAEFEADGTQRKCTINPGGSLVILNNGNVDACVNFTSGTVTTTQPVGQGQRYIKAGKFVCIPLNCSSFTFKSTGASTWLQVSKGLSVQP